MVVVLVLIFSPLSQDAFFPVRFTKSCFYINAGLVQSRGYFAQLEHSEGPWNKTCEAVPLGWHLGLHFEMALLISFFSIKLCEKIAEHILCASSMET